MNAWPGPPAEPPALAQRFWPAWAIAGAALGGLGIVLWLAANWQGLGRMGRFALLQGAVLVLCTGAALRPRARPALALLALLCIGGLLACFGQTYQTGADPWQLFALWALLALPLAGATRSDVLWAPWALVAAVAISLWTYTHTGHRWRVEPQDLATYAAAWTLGALLVAALGPFAARFTGAGTWALRTAGTLAVAMLAFTALFSLFQSRIPPQFLLALGVLAAAVALMVAIGWFDLFLLSVLALALDTLLVAGFARWLFFGRAGGDEIGRLLLVGLFAAGLLAGSVSLVMRAARRHA